MRKLLLIFLFVSGLIAQASAQDRTVSGKVTSSEDNSTLPGVTVVLKGTTTGTTTDLDGNYKLSVPGDGGILVYSFVGLATQEIEIGSRSVIDLAMDPDAQQLTEVVVTALGIDRNAREVVYANQSVGGDELLSSPNKNALEALRGKAAGVRLSTGSGSVGASTRIVLRGEGSLTGNNNALIVIDGVAIDNSSSTGGDNVTDASRGSSGYADYGNRFNDLNPADIESLTILKGPSATSLYGSRGTSGVILITTKKGSSKNLQVSFNSSYSQERAYIITERQNTHGQGYDNESFDTGENWAWGPAFDGVVRPWTSPIDVDGDGQLEWLSRPYSAVPDQLENFFNVGQTFSNDISISGAKEGFSYYASYSNVDQDGILDNTGYKRNTLTVNATAKLSDRLSSTFKVSYGDVRLNTAQEGARAFEGNNAWAMVLQSPTNIPFNELRDYNNPYHGIDGYWGSYSSVNPYYILNEYGNDGKINNVLGNLSLTYNVMEGLDIVGRFGVNVVSTEFQSWTPKFTPATQLVFGNNLDISTRTSKHVSTGRYGYYHKQSKNTDISLMTNYTKALTEELRVDVSAGYNFFQQEYEFAENETQGGLLVEGLYNLGNSTLTPQARLNRYSKRLVGVLGNVRLGFRDAVFLEYSARNDWSSTLPEENNSFFYQAVGASAVITDLLDINSNVLNFLKIRGSIGTTGKDAPAYVLNSSFNGNPGVFGGSNPVQFPIGAQAASSVGNQIGSPTLTPEKTTTYEVGADVGFFDDRVNLEYTYYHSNHADQIVQVTLPRSSGYQTTYLNVGEMTNKGHELSLTLKPIHGLVNGLDLELFGTYAKNVNEVVKVADGIDELNFGSNNGITVVAKEGLPYGTFKAQEPLTNDAGQVVVDPNTGYPLYTDGESYLGNYQPDYLMSFGANAKFKGIGFNILFDMKQGGVFNSYTKFYTEFNGTSVHTSVFGREAFVYPNSVIENTDVDGNGLGTYTANNIEITEQNLYTAYDPASSTYLIDASYLKLREVGLSYDLPKSLIGKTPFRSVRIAVFGKNLKMWLPDENTFSDPEINGPGAGTSNAQGIETSQTPTARSMGVRMSLTF
ncbi:TonB-linked outer membrane protein, SusC/RagA family [Reichenbachiella faecimaris]|uniref:TonB-linked outer membrane protein, SusC/RagA family n=1 Tax=Reichenbachiella faecimaris TaxID=692418 RepID=A0A1W2G8L1_REIFA|nr:SusC/RagA family TonB-linked outer membrane protein [Reichenbachiella faecimaris]SMD33007.1 TonB-linked outer membrane protein, SusC/RagA family [Reichenbachiella faecimaris]